MDSFLVAIGVLVILAGFFFEKFRPGALGTSSGRELPKWLGQLLFVAFGAWCIYLGLTNK
jgi:hypothetical protein